MTPAARYASAIAVLDDVQSGAPAEKSLTNWARANRYAGAKDRAAVRDHVYDVLRRKRSCAALGGGDTGRALILGLLRTQGVDPDSIFGAGGYGPDALTADESGSGRLPEGAEAADLPDWLLPIWQRDLGANAQMAAGFLQERGPITLRVNLRRGTRERAIAVLAEDGIICTPFSDVNTALQVIENERKVHLSQAFQQGLVEVQDLASQAAVARLKIDKNANVLDYCAGGGGKALALADRFDCTVTAHDISTRRMADIPTRANRAGVAIQVAEPNTLFDRPKFDVVFVDAPCSGSGTWRRTPEEKWAITSDKLLNYNELQYEVLVNASGLLRQGGTLVYATCSVLSCENFRVLDRFMQTRPTWKIYDQSLRLPDANGDGFFYSVLQNT